MIPNSLIHLKFISKYIYLFLFTYHTLRPFPHANIAGEYKVSKKVVLYPKGGKSERSLQSGLRPL